MSTSERTLVVHHRIIHVLNPFQVILSSTPRDVNSVAGAIISNEALHPCGRAFQNRDMLKGWKSFAQCAVPELNLIVTAIGDSREFGLKLSLSFVVAVDCQDEKNQKDCIKLHIDYNSINITLSV